MNGDKIVWVDENIGKSLSGWYAVEYEIMNKDGDFFQHKMFDRKTDAKKFISECKKEIKKEEALRYLKY